MTAQDSAKLMRAWFTYIKESGRNPLCFLANNPDPEVTEKLKHLARQFHLTPGEVADTINCQIATYHQ